MALGLIFCCFSSAFKTSKVLVDRQVKRFEERLFSQLRGQSVQEYRTFDSGVFAKCLDVVAKN